MLRFAAQCLFGGINAIKDLLVAIYMNQFWWRYGAAAGGVDLVKAGADGEQAVAVFKGIARAGDGGGAKDHTAMQWMFAGEAADTAEGGADRCAEQFGEGDKFWLGIDGAPAYQYAWMFGVEQIFGGAADFGISVRQFFLVGGGEVDG